MFISALFLFSEMMTAWFLDDEVTNIKMLIPENIN